MSRSAPPRPPTPHAQLDAQRIRHRIRRRTIPAEARGAPPARSSSMLDSGTPLHAVGLQCHLRGAKQIDSDGVPRFRRRDARSTGLDVYVTELDVIDEDLPRRHRERDAIVAAKRRDALSGHLRRRAPRQLADMGLERPLQLDSQMFPRADDCPIGRCRSTPNSNPNPSWRRWRSSPAPPPDARSRPRRAGAVDKMLLRHTSQYMISSAIIAMLGFLSAAVFTRLLSPGDYGVYIVGFGDRQFRRRRRLHLGALFGDALRVGGRQGRRAHDFARRVCDLGG